ncbi:hypothetical protein V6C27_03020 [Peptococcaceae bacterium 1198_IL3148]
MTFEEVKQELIDSGKDPDDFNIEIKENTVKISPKKLDDKLQNAKTKIVGLQQENQQLEQSLADTNAMMLELMESILV